MMTATTLLARILWEREHILANYEDLASEFLLRTGLMAPGKSEPMSMYVDEQRTAERRQAWDGFCKAIARERTEQIRLIVGAAAEDRCTYGHCGSCPSCTKEDDPCCTP